MHPAVNSGSRTTPLSLTPQTGARVVWDGGTASAQSNAGSRLRDLLRAEPTPIHFAVAAALYWVVPWTVARLTALRLPHDDLFSAVAYLMWSGSAKASQQIAPMFDAATMVHLVAASILVGAALLPRETIFAPVHATARRLYRYSIALPLWTIVASNLARIVADRIYSLAGIVRWDMTPIIARFEAPVIERFQHAFASPAMSVFASNFYSAIWLAPIAFAGFLLVAADKPRAMNALIVAYVLTAVCAIPFYVLLPTFDPWTTNALYGAAGVKTGIRYLYTNPSVPTLTSINTTLHWAAGSAFPSLHVAFPLVVSLVLRKHRMAWASAFMLLMTMTTMFVIVYLGRHWIVDAVAAVPFAFAVVAIGERIPLNVVLEPRSVPRFIQRSEAATASKSEFGAPNWLTSAAFTSGFATLLYQIVWERALVGTIGVGTESMTLILTALALGIGIGILVGIAISRRAKTLMLPVAIGQIAIGAFGFFSVALLRSVEDTALVVSGAVAALATLAVLVPPAIVIGATISLLVKSHEGASDLARRLSAVGIFGAAASGLAALVLLRFLGQVATAQAAAALSIGAGLLLLAHARASMSKL